MKQILHRSWFLLFCFHVDGNSDLDLKKWEDIKFISHSTGDLLLDVFRSDDKQIRPTILCLHGGFWAKGSKKFMHPLALDLVEKGYIAVCSNYRLTDVASAPAQLHDVFSAIRFLRENATDFGMNPQKVGVTGSSAGGYLAVMSAVFDSGDKSTRPNAAVGMGAPNRSTVSPYSKFNSSELVKIHGWILPPSSSEILKTIPNKSSDEGRSTYCYHLRRIR